MKYIFVVVAALFLVGCERSHTLEGWPPAINSLAENCSGELTIELDVAYRSRYKVTCVQDGPYEASLTSFPLKD